MVYRYLNKQNCFRTFALSLHIFYCGQVLGQSDETVYVKNFKNTTLINAQTTEVNPKKGIEFNIKHRFGIIKPDNTIISNFLGMDLPSNIRLGFGIPISKNFQIGFGRTKFNKMYDIEGKYILLRQTSDNRKPIALAAYFNTAIMTARFPSVPSNGYFSDGTPFEYRFSHRLSYNTQLIVSRNFGNTVALQLATVMIYQNLVAPNRDNHIFVIPFSGAIRTGLSSSIIFEYSYILNKQYPSNLNPASIGYEIGTPGHTFQIFISSGQDILEQEFYRNEPANYLKGNFLLGFNIKRVFRKKSS